MMLPALSRLGGPSPKPCLIYLYTYVLYEQNMSMEWTRSSRLPCFTRTEASIYLGISYLEER